MRLEKWVMKSLGLLWLAWGVGCATTDDEDLAQKTHYTLALAPAEDAPTPLPLKTPILVKWHYDDGTVETESGFYGWDFDRDGRFEMVQVLSPGGDRYAYDFDGDGVIDLQEGEGAVEPAANVQGGQP